MILNFVKRLLRHLQVLIGGMQYYFIFYFDLYYTYDSRQEGSF